MWWFGVVVLVGFLLHGAMFPNETQHSCVIGSDFSKGIHSHHVVWVFFESPALVFVARLNFLVELILLLVLLPPNSEDDCEIKFLLFIKTRQFGCDRCSTIIVDGLEKVFY